MFFYLMRAPFSRTSLLVLTDQASDQSGVVSEPHIMRVSSHSYDCTSGLDVKCTRSERTNLLKRFWVMSC